MRTEIDLNESEIDLNECEHFQAAKQTLDRSEIDVSWINLSSNGNVCFDNVAFSSQV